MQIKNGNENSLLFFIILSSYLLVRKSHPLNFVKEDFFIFKRLLLIIMIQWISRYVSNLRTLCI